MAVRIEAGASLFLALLLIGISVGVFCFAGFQSRSRTRWNTLAVQLLFVLLLAAIVLVLSAIGWQRIPDDWQQAMTERETFQAELRVDTIPLSTGPSSSAAGEGTEFRATLLMARWPGAAVPGFGSPAAISLPVAVRASEAAAWRELNPGDRFLVPGNLLQHPSPRTTAAAFVPRGPPQEITRRDSAVLPQLRREFTQRTSELWREWPEAAALLNGMVLGDRSAQSEELDEAMKVAGLTHLTAVSGSNCLMLLVGVLAVARWLRLPRRLGILIGGVSLAGFVALVGPDPSVIRAAVMAALGLLAVLGGRRARAGPLLCLAVIGMLLSDPWLSVDFGFLLSVAATAGLLALGRPLYEGLRRCLPDWLALAVTAPLAAQLFCAPLLVLLQPRLTLYAVPANLLAAAAVPPVTALGMIAVLSSSLLTPLTTAALWLAGLGASWVAQIAKITAVLPGAALPWAEGSAGFFLMLLLSGIIMIGFAAFGPSRSRMRETGTRWRACFGRTRAGTMLLPLLVTGSAALAGWAGYVLARGSVRIFSGLPW
ncbi:ComEC/Rec2 family competence protein [Acaricomes phytoseiuli]|uniref:ComEC/Rec2 family competence protein n=1 Tax=Acaricomes phytoseiuli TaxID=291968 RepID=UPI0003A33A71|nr:ComEC/Rec2 family competence protein [Acaricomes phytoseiuli]